MTREQARAFGQAGLLVLPVGATEQHGPHLPVAADSLLVEHVARSAAAAVASEVAIAVAPTLPFGCSDHHLPFSGTLSLDGNLYYRVLCRLGYSLVRSGFRRIFIVNGHGGNHELIQLVARDLALRYPADVAAGSWWAMAWDALIEVGGSDAGRIPGHAGAFESSLVLALRPDLVHEPRPRREPVVGETLPAFRMPYRIERHQAWQSEDGFSDNPAAGSAELGSAYIETGIRVLGRAFVEFATATADPQESSSGGGDAAPPPPRQE